MRKYDSYLLASGRDDPKMTYKEEIEQTLSNEKKVLGI